MVLVIKKFVKIYGKDDDVPARYKNLRKNKFVKAFSQPFPTIPQILVAEYGLKWDDKIIVFHTKEVPRNGWSNYRTPFKKVYYGTVRGFGGYLRGFLRNRAGQSKRSS